MEYSLILVRVFVSDLERSIAFYTKALGMELDTRTDDMGWAELSTGACNLALEQLDPQAASGPGEDDESLVGRFVGVSLSVPDVYARYEDLMNRGVEFLGPPEVMPWGGVLAHFRDPDKNVLTLVGLPRADDQAA
ncbi:MAG: VOC family protein [Myxococcota bacterium]|nr:VOC family protein [Myxococcota bacterium]